MKQTEIIFIAIIGLMLSCTGKESNTCADGAGSRKSVCKRLSYQSLTTFQSDIYSSEEYLELKKIVNEVNKCESGYWTVVLVNDSTTQIQLNRLADTIRSENTFSYWESRFFHLISETENFLILGTHTGSDWWNDLLIPLNSSVQEHYIENRMAYDEQYQYAAIEGQGNNLFIIINLLNGKTQTVPNRWKPVGSSLNHHCIQNVRIENDFLYWDQYYPYYSGKDQEISAQKSRIII